MRPFDDSDTMTDESTLRKRLRAKLEQEAAGTSAEAQHGDEEHDDMDDDEMDDDEMDEMADSEDMQEAAQMVAEAAGEQIAPEQVLELLDPLMGEDTRDAPTELAGDVDEEAVEDLVSEAVEAELDERLTGVVTEETLDEKLDEVVGALADETRDVLQESAVGSTPAAVSGPSIGDGDVSSDDLFSDKITITEDN